MKKVIIGIVGSEAVKFTKAGEERARALIRSLIEGSTFGEQKAFVSSGHCHLGGVDIFAEEEAKALNAYDESLIFPPKTRSWIYYKERNIKIAEASHVVICLSVDKLPQGYTGMRFPRCYHCVGRNEPEHVKSGGCWTTKYAREKLGKRGDLFVIENF